MVFKKALNFYINSSIHVAAAVVAFSIITFLNYDRAVEVELLWFIFFGSVTGYNFVKYAGIAGLHHHSLTESLRWIQVFSLLSFFAFLGSAFFIEPKILYWTGLFGIFTLLYALPLFSGKRNLRSFSGLKIFIIAFVWAGVSVILPLVSEGLTPVFKICLEFLQRFLLMIALILPFEIRDLKYDLEGLGTIPQKIGVKRSKILGSILSILVIILELIINRPGTNSLMALFLTVVISTVFLWRSKKEQPTYYASFWVESIPIMYLLILLVFRSV